MVLPNLPDYGKLRLQNCIKGPPEVQSGRFVNMPLPCQILLLEPTSDLKPDLLIAANPTRGLDVGAIEYIHKALIQQRDQNKAVLLMSFELDEILNVSDRIIVMYDGKIIATLNANETNEQEIGLMMAGTSYDEVLRLREEGGVNNEQTV